MLNRSIRCLLAVVLACGVFAATSAAAAAVHSAPGTGELHDDEVAALMQTVEVSGELPGPGLWRVSRGDNVLWLIGTLQPVPSNMVWRSRELEERLAQAQAIVAPPGVVITTGRGMLHAMTLLPSALGARKNPDRARLQDVLSPALYQRWASLKKTYLGNSRSVERWRPIFAAQKLHKKAVKRAGLTSRSPVADLVRAGTKARDLPVISSSVVFTIEAPRQALRDFKAGPLNDTECFERTLTRLETDLDLLRARATAWATGDLDTLRELRDMDPESACISAVLDATALQKHGIDDLKERTRAAWLESAEQALEQHAVSIGMLPISQMLKSDGYLADLAARGYRVVAPDEDGYELEDEGHAGSPDAAAQPRHAGVVPE